jgi:glutamyl-tRNA synthetase
MVQFKSLILGPLAAAFHAIRHNSAKEVIKVEFNQLEKEPSLSQPNGTIDGINHVLRALGQLFPDQFYAKEPLQATHVDYWLDYANDQLFAPDFKQLSSCFDVLNNHLTLKSFMVGYHVTIADFAIWGALKANAIFNKQLKNGKINAENLSRWYDHMNSLDSVNDSLQAVVKAKDAVKDRSEQGNMDIPLPGAFKGGVVTRFPPEPSGYLHIGHAKAALLNDYFARAYEGKLILRFDDTNPSKEKMEFEQSIKEDLAMLNIKPDVINHTSNHFAKLYEYALVLIKKGLAYVDDTDVDTVSML